MLVFVIFKILLANIALFFFDSSQDNNNYMAITSSAIVFTCFHMFAMVACHYDTGEIVDDPCTAHTYDDEILPKDFQHTSIHVHPPTVNVRK
jgi:hypothetical protein